MVQDTTTTFRLNRELLTAAAEKARREQVPLSELLRTALRHAVKEAP